MIFGGLIGTAFLIFLGIRIAQAIKKKRRKYGGAGVIGPEKVRQGMQAQAVKQDHKTGLETSGFNRSIFDNDALTGRLLITEAGSEGEEALLHRSGLDRIKQLPRIQQAVVWAELLGKPRSEKSIF